MKKVISIGINNAKGLTPLQAAVSGAIEFSEWAKSQDYDVSLFTDDNKSVSISEIFIKIAECIDTKTYSQIIVFFAGHGILRSPNQEVWLLNDAKSNPNESINLTTSIDYARTSGIPHVVFISDACRVLPNELSLTANGSTIFPINNTNQDTVIDLFYATRPGNPANEISGIDSSKKFGIFTQCLIEGLKGEEPFFLKRLDIDGQYYHLNKYYDIASLKVDKNYKNSGGANWVFNSTDLSNFLKKSVPNKAYLKSITLNQNPEIRIESGTSNNFLAWFEDVTAKELLIKNSLIDIDKNNNSENSSLLKNDKEIQESIQMDITNGIEPRNNHLDDKPSFKSILQRISPFPENHIDSLESNFVNQSEKIFESKGRESFETKTGFTIVGTKIVDVVVSNSQREIFEENDNTHIRIYKKELTSSALIILNNQISIPLAVLEGFIGTLVFENETLLTVNYTPSRNNNDLFHEFEQKEKELNFIRAFVATSAQNGFDYKDTFKKEFDNKGEINYSDSGGFLRKGKSLDPSLGLYAIYAYVQAGKNKEVESVFDCMKYDNSLLFDVSMLAKKLNEHPDKITPFCPMISTGWAYGNRFEEFLNPIVKKASKYLIPNLWTTFSSQGTKILIEAIENGQLK